MTSLTQASETLLDRDGRVPLDSQRLLPAQLPCDDLLESSQLVVRCMMTMKESVMISGPDLTGNRYVSSRLKKRGLTAIRVRRKVHETKVGKALAMVRNERGRFIRRTRRISHLLRFMAMGSATSVLNSLDSIITSAIAKFR
jgi:hypothetical protein